MAIPLGGKGSAAADRARAPAPSAMTSTDVLDALPDAVLVAGEQGRFVGANAAACALTGYAEDELREMTIGDLVVERPETTDEVFRRFADEGTWRGSVELRRKDGSVVVVESRAARVADDLFVAVLRERGPTAGAALGGTPWELSAIIEGSADAIFSKTLDGTILSWNPAAERIYGYRPQEVIGKHVSILAPEDRKGEIEEILERLRRGEQVRDLRTKRVTRAGREVDIWLSISPVRDGSGRIVGAATIARDITEQMRVERELERARDELSTITRASADGITIQDSTGRVVYANDAAAHLSGYPDAASFLAAPIEQILGRHQLRREDGSPFPIDELPGRRVLQGEPEAEAVLKVRVVPTGEESWRFVRSTPLLDDEGRVRHVVNVFHDITELKRAEEELRFRALLLQAQADASEEGILVIDPQGRLVSWNRRLQEVLGVGDEAFADATAETLLRAMIPSLRDPEETAARLRHYWEHPHEDADDEIGFKDGRVLKRHSTPLLDDEAHFYGRVSFFRDVTAERKREHAQRFLAETSRELGSSLDYEATLQRVASMAVPELADWCAVDVLEPDGSLRLLAVAHVDPAKVQWAYELRRRFPVDIDAEQGLANVIRTGRPELYPLVPMQQMEAAATGDAELLEIVHQLRITSVMIVPLIARGRTLGALQFVWAESGRSYDEDDLRLAQDLADRAAFALDNARLYRERDQIAQTLQQSLLPGPLPAIEGVRLAARYRAAGRGIEVGGDFYDVFELGGGAHALVIGDVCGKGPKAAALMGAARHTVRTAAMHERRPSEVLRVLNTALLERATDQWFCTAAYVRLRRGAEGARLTVSCGGHPLPAVVRGDGTVELVGRPGSLLGVFPEVELSDVPIDLAPGDTLVLYTDGVTDEQQDGEEFGEQRFLDVLRAVTHEPPDAIADAIERAVLAFRPQDPADDIALLVAKVVE